MLRQQSPPMWLQTSSAQDMVEPSRAVSSKRIRPTSLGPDHLPLDCSLLPWRRGVPQTCWHGQLDLGWGLQQQEPCRCDHVPDHESRCLGCRNGIHACQIEVIYACQVEVEATDKLVMGMVCCCLQGCTGAQLLQLTDKGLLQLGVQDAAERQALLAARRSLQQGQQQQPQTQPQQQQQQQAQSLAGQDAGAKQLASPGPPALAVASPGTQEAAGASASINGVPSGAQDAAGADRDAASLGVR